jgi:hypothetical protein
LMILLQQCMSLKLKKSHLFQHEGEVKYVNLWVSQLREEISKRDMHNQAQFVIVYHLFNLHMFH